MHDTVPLHATCVAASPRAFWGLPFHLLSAFFSISILPPPPTPITTQAEESKSSVVSWYAELYPGNRPVPLHGGAYFSRAT